MADFSANPDFFASGFLQSLAKAVSCRTGLVTRLDSAITKIEFLKGLPDCFDQMIGSGCYCADFIIKHNIIKASEHVGSVRILVDIDSNVDYSFHSDLRLHVLRQHAQLYSS